MFEVARQASSPSLCASVRPVPWAGEAEQQLSRLAPSDCQLSADVRIFGVGLLDDPKKDPLMYVKFEVARQENSPSLCASVQAVPWADEAEQQLSRLAPSGCQLSADIRIFGAGLGKALGRYPPIPRLLLEFEVSRQASKPQSLCLCASSAMGS